MLEPQGATFRTRDSDFLVSDNPDFHPTDVLEDADGSLLVIDTGGWYKLCCPTSQLAKPDVRGAIYRVRRTGAPKVNDPRGLKLAWTKMKPAELATLPLRFQPRYKEFGDATNSVGHKVKENAVEYQMASYPQNGIAPQPGGSAATLEEIKLSVPLGLVERPVHVEMTDIPLK